MNKELIREIIRAVELEPDRMNMTTWLSSTDSNICGTVGCIAGTAIVLDAQMKNRLMPKSLGHLTTLQCIRDGAAALDITVHEGGMLFTEDRWWRWAMEQLGIEAGDCFGLGDIEPKHVTIVLQAILDGELAIGDYGGELWAEELEDDGTVSISLILDEDGEP
jgi:hypothetical protein